MIPKSHPRYESLKQREILVEGYRAGATALEGLIAYGRGEAFDYLLKEKTPEQAKTAIEASTALLLSAKKPIISVNGNTAVLCPKELVELSRVVGAKLEINLFYRTDERIRIIERILREKGAEEVLGINPSAEIPGIDSSRRLVDHDGIYGADAVFVALEDGDRTKALVDSMKKVVAVDLNPLSRTARTASITIIDNVVRAVPLLIKRARALKSLKRSQLTEIYTSFNNENNLRDSIHEIIEGLKQSKIH
jgi:4-phosphopantoate--beta-alanine ligase